jgi:hypothetical protein
MITPIQLWQNQIAATCMKLLNIDFNPAMEAGSPIEEITGPSGY